MYRKIILMTAALALVGVACGGDGEAASDDVASLSDVIVSDTAAVPYTHVTGGSRVTYATGLAVIQAFRNIRVKEAIQPLIERLNVEEKSRLRGSIVPCLA